MPLATAATPNLGAKMHIGFKKCRLQNAYCRGSLVLNACHPLYLLALLWGMCHIPASENPSGNQWSREMQINKHDTTVFWRHEHELSNFCRVLKSYVYETKIIAWTIWIGWTHMAYTKYCIVFVYRAWQDGPKNTAPNASRSHVQHSNTGPTQCDNPTIRFGSVSHCASDRQPQPHCSRLWATLKSSMKFFKSYIPGWLAASC